MHWPTAITPSAPTPSTARTFRWSPPPPRRRPAYRDRCPTRTCSTSARSRALGWTATTFSYPSTTAPRWSLPPVRSATWSVHRSCRPTRRSRMKLLVIDGDARTRESLEVALQLQWQDAVVLSAVDGEAGLKLFY